MNDLAIRAEELGKRYTIVPPEERPNTLRDAVAQMARNALQAVPTMLRNRKDDDRPENTIWALRDVSFEIDRGEVVGIIGPNGAGKSTILKILSRITEPTTGEVEIHGRVGSLLEVGTGFHSELTGRENIYLNGAILGMGRQEIDRKFDEMVAFAEVERFIDTPVKHYSSGMYLRLAFAVAAHLEPEILIVDEVLAVGDAEFQRKCLGKMENVAGEGRTVVFVTHDMDAIHRLCSRCILLEQGSIVATGSSQAVVRKYLSRHISKASPGQTIDLSSVPRRGTGEARFVSARYASLSDEAGDEVHSHAPVNFDLAIVTETARSVPSMAVTLRDQRGTMLLNADIVEIGQTLRLQQGRNTVRLRIEALHLRPGTYVVDLWIGDLVGVGYDHIERAFELEVFDTGRVGVGTTPDSTGVVACRFALLPGEPAET